MSVFDCCDETGIYEDAIDEIDSTEVTMGCNSPLLVP
jgi:hypothetical protein